MEFLRYTPENNSRFVGTEFTFTDSEPNLAAVTIWDTDNILFDNCTFDGYDTGVIAHDAGCRVLNSTLRDCDFGLEIFATSPVSSGAPMTIDNNLFDDIFLDGINSHTSELSKFLEISNNNFNKVNVGMYLAGTHDFRVIDNKIENEFAGIHIWDSGTGISEINCNTLEQLDMAIIAEGDCSGVQVLDNGFISSYSDVAVFGVGSQAGKLFEFQGEEDMPANNCFSPAGALHLASFNNTIPYTYYVPDDVPMTECRIPSSTGGNNIQYTSRFLSIECDRPLIGPGDDKNLYLDLLNQYHYTSGSGGTPSQGQTSMSIYEMRRQLRSGLQQWLSDGLHTGVTNDLEDVLIATDPEEGLKQLYGLHLQRGEWTQAQYYLTQLRSDPKHVAFADVQDINLARLQASTSVFVPDATQWVTLEQAALNNTPSGNYAKGLLSLLRGDSFPSQTPAVWPQAIVSSPSAGGANDSHEQVVLAPNPAKGAVTVNCSISSTNVVRLLDQMGRVSLVTQTDDSGSVTINIGHLPNGLYFIKVMGEDIAVPVIQSLMIAN